jgi:hypothetical protein
MVAEDFLGLDFLFLAGFAVFFAFLIWGVFFLIRKNISRCGIKNIGNFFKVFSLFCILYIIQAIIFTNSAELRILLLPIAIAISHAVFRLKA